MIFLPHYMWEENKKNLFPAKSFYMQKKVPKHILTEINRDFSIIANVRRSEDCRKK